MSALTLWSVLAVGFLLLGLMVVAIVMGGAVLRRRRAWRREQMDPVRSGRWPVQPYRFRRELPARPAEARAEINRRFGR